MTHRSAVRFAVACFALYALAVHWPGILPFTGVRPFVLGLPFNFFWIVAWVVLGGIALAAVELTRAQDAAPRPSGDPDGARRGGARNGGGDRAQEDA